MTGEQPSKATQQMKAMELTLVEKHACRVVPHDCHLQSPPRWFQGKGNHTCTWKRKSTLIHLLSQLQVIYVKINWSLQ